MTDDLSGFAAREAGDPIPERIATGTRIKCNCGFGQAYVHTVGRRNDMLECVNCGRWILDEDGGYLTMEKASAGPPRAEPTPERIAEAMEGGGEVWVDAEKAMEPVPIILDRDGIWRDAQTGEAVGPNSDEAKNSDYRGRYTHTKGDDWRWWDGKKLHRFRYIGQEYEEEGEEVREVESGYAKPTPPPPWVTEYSFVKAKPIQSDDGIICDSRPRNTADDIADVCDQIRDMLLEKNRKYGDSALEPVRIFSRASAVEQILVRLDDKLSRLRSAQSDEDEDVIDDLIGYLVLLKIARSR